MIIMTSVIGVKAVLHDSVVTKLEHGKQAKISKYFFKIVQQTIVLR